MAMVDEFPMVALVDHLASEEAIVEVCAAPVRRGGSSAKRACRFLGPTLPLGVRWRPCRGLYNHSRAYLIGLCGSANKSSGDVFECSGGEGSRPLPTPGSRSLAIRCARRCAIGVLQGEIDTR